MKNKILLIGGGGHCRVILDTLSSDRKYLVAGIIDVQQKVGLKIFETSVIGTEKDLAKYHKAGIKDCFISMGSVGDPKLRVKFYRLAKRIGFSFPNIISPLATVSKRASFGEGNFIAPGVIINAGTVISDNCIINTGAIIEHDCIIDNFVHIAPGVVLSGGVEIGQYSHIGTGSIVIQGIKIGANAVIGAGSLVVEDIKSKVIAYGSPCKPRNKNG